MRCLTLTQPWASLVAAGEKRVETRSWQTSYRGPLAIHAAKGFPPGARALCVQEPFAAALRRAGVSGLGLLSPAKALPLGQVVAVCRLDLVEPTEKARAFLERGAGAVEIPFGDFSPGRFAWYLSGIERLEAPVAARGALGLWTLRDPERAAVGSAYVEAVR